MDRLMINRDSGVPPYRQLAAHVAEQIRGGRLKSGVRLPTVREMVHRYGLSTNTVQKALQLLKTDGLAVGRQGAGLFVSGGNGTEPSDIRPELWVHPLPWSDEARVGVLNRFHAKFPRVKVVETTVGSRVRWMEQGQVEAQAGILEDVTDLTLEVYGRRDDPAGLFDALRVGGRLHMMPTSINAQVMACNETVFERCGVELPGPDWDWETFLTISRRLTKGAAGQYGVGIYQHWDFLLPLIWQAGGALFNAEGTESRLDQPAARRAGELVRALGATAFPSSRETTTDQLFDLFAQNRLGMTVTGVWGYYTLNSRKCRWVARPLPRGIQAATWLSARGYGLERGLAQADAARQFLRECAQVSLGDGERERRPALPLHRELERDGANEQVYRAALPTARVWLSDIRPDRRTVRQVESLSAVNRVMGSLLFGSEPVERLMKHLARDMDAQLSAAEQAHDR